MFYHGKEKLFYLNGEYVTLQTTADRSEAQFNSGRH